MMSYHRSIVTIALSYISHIEPDIGRKSRNLYTPPTLNPPYWVTPSEFRKDVYWKTRIMGLQYADEGMIIC